MAAAAHIVAMKKREELDMTAIVDATVVAFHESKGSPGGPIDPVKKELVAAAFMPVIWHTVQAVLDQLTKDEETGTEEPAAEFVVPDSLEGLEGFEGLTGA
ncbi:hypothetical protein [Arthrobacter caoxuetaonis]|uniref:Uncharacterized protein n=1 Tax=Arthrobacter caoxuetaonis TaxID=2886935 RepID=A0A9X1SE37_9MICC|nr:hypothetical protein [Arthrobacter caoxuetaonis]MCC3299788.1 hypothetical protein [Arthrobacter caoxuetaonis]USQ59312.1 hypothetical protein NF551_17150 [Arthrobacter caoxuetaonis]